MALLRCLEKLLAHGRDELDVANYLTLSVSSIVSDLAVGYDGTRTLQAYKP